MMNFNSLAQAGNILSSFGSLGNVQNTFSTKRDVMTVNGFQEAKDLKLEKGERLAMLDANSDVLYIKECDDIGKYTLRVYECKEITERYEKENTPANISKAEFDSLVSSLNEMKQLLKGDRNEFNVKKQKDSELKFTN